MIRNALHTILSGAYPSASGDGGTGTATIVVLVILNLPLYAVMAWVIFGSWTRFLEDLKTPVGRGSLANLKWLYFLICALTLTYLEYRLFVYCFPA